MDRFTWSLLWLAALVGAVVGILRLTVLRWWVVPDDGSYFAVSMSPTLSPGDLVLLWRAGPPQLGDLAVCEDPESADDVVVGRLVGHERTRIEIVGDRVLMDGREAKRERACVDETFTVVSPQSGQERELRCVSEELGGKVFQRGGMHREELAPIGDRVQLGPDEVYLVSDNRQFPFDSRDFGPLKRSACREWVFFRIWGKAGWMDAKHRLTRIQ